MDLELRKALENGLSFRKIFMEIVIYAISIFLGFYWKDQFTEIIQTYWPAGHGLINKITLGIILTVVLVLVVYLVLWLEKKGLHHPGNRSPV